MQYKLIGYKEKNMFEFYDLIEYEAFKSDGNSGVDLTKNLIPVYVATDVSYQDMKSFVE